MRHYCITGGIGAGKSYISEMLRQRGIEIYDSDKNAKRIIASSTPVKEKITALVGPDSYIDGVYNKNLVTQFLMKSEENKLALNAIIHPMVMEDYYLSEIEWMECAIVYEAKLDGYFDKIVCVTAPEDIRIERIMKRNGVSREIAKRWIDIQTSQDIIADKADFIIVNDSMMPLDIQIDKLLSELTNN